MIVTELRTAPQSLHSLVSVEVGYDLQQGIVTE